MTDTQRRRWTRNAVSVSILYGDRTRWFHAVARDVGQGGMGIKGIRTFAPGSKIFIKVCGGTGCLSEVTVVWANHSLLSRMGFCKSRMGVKLNRTTENFHNFLDAVTAQS
jgi:hypothetical protein